MPIYLKLTAAWNEATFWPGKCLYKVAPERVGGREAEGGIP